MIKSFVVIGCVFELVFAVVADHLDPCPQHRGLPDGWRRADNLIDGRSLYRLDLRNAIRGYEPSKIYRLRVHTTSRRHKFNDASLMIDPLDPDCGIGRLIVDDERHYSPKDCPDFVSTQQKEPMGRAHFKWEAPQCGCVHIRIRVHANSSYYIEDEYTSNGPLARTICPKADAVVTTTEAPPKVERPSRADKLGELCKLSKEKPMGMLMKEKRFMEKRQLRFESEFEKERLAIALEQRQIETEQCCIYEGTHQLECFGDVRRRRIDQFCGTGEPDVPFTSSRFNWIKQKESECCWQIGEDRYHCFNYTNDLQRMMNDGNSLSDRVKSEDKDDFDPANYIDDYKSKDEGVESVSKGSSRHNKQKNDKNYGRGDKVDEEDGGNDDSTEDDDDINLDKDDESIDKDDDLANKKTRKTTKFSKTLVRRRKVQRPEKHLKDQVKKPDDVEDGEDYEADYSQDYEDPPKPRDVDDRKLNPDICCFNGITAGTRVADEGVDGCFEMADRFNAIFLRWNKNCDRNFVVCCMRVVEGRTDFRTGQSTIIKPTKQSNEISQDTIVTYAECINILLGHMPINTALDRTTILNLDQLNKGDIRTQSENIKVPRNKSKYFRQKIKHPLSNRGRTNAKLYHLIVTPSSEHKTRKLRTKLRRKQKENSNTKTDGDEIFSSKKIIVLQGKSFLYNNSPVTKAHYNTNPFKQKQLEKLYLLSHRRRKKENETLKPS